MACALGAFADADARSIFVAIQGRDDTGDGTPDRPYRSLTHALDQAEPDDILEIRQGTYREPGEIRVRVPRLTLRAHAGEAVVLAAPLDSEETHAACIWLDPDADGTTLSGLEITGGYFYGITLETKWDWGDPSDRSGACQVLVENCRIHDTGRDGVKIKPNCDDITIRNCEIFRTGVGPANDVDPNAEGVDCVNGDRVRIADCHVHDIHSTGIYLKGGSTDAVVERCRVERCGEGGILLGFDTSPEFFDLAANPAYYENLRGTVRDNIIADTGWEGLGLYAAFQPRLLGNTLLRTCQQSVHAPIYFGLSYQDWDPDAGRPASAQVVIRGNLVMQPRGYSGPILAIRHSEDLGGLSGLEGWPDMDFNGFWIVGGAPITFSDARPGSDFEALPYDAWQRRSGADAHGLANDPSLVANYTLCLAPGVPPPVPRIVTEPGTAPRFVWQWFRDPSRRETDLEVLSATNLEGPWTPLPASGNDGNLAASPTLRESVGPTGTRLVTLADPGASEADVPRFYRLRASVRSGD